MKFYYISTIIEKQKVGKRCQRQEKPLIGKRKIVS